VVPREKASRPFLGMSGFFLDNCGKSWFYQEEGGNHNEL